jgi:hypothetical protein
VIELSHKKLKVWFKSKKLVSEVYKLTANFPKSEVYGITSQLRRASISIISNLSEGASRNSSQEKKRFFEISIELGLLNQIEIENLSKLSNEVFAMLTNLIKRYEK